MDFEAANKRGEIEEIIDGVEQRFRNFKNFDIILNAPGDHHYLQDKKSLSNLYFMGSNFGKQIEEEWKILKTGLLDSIYVRTYESRIDLMRAVIVGPPRTPYFNGLFFFDILFPSRYPKSSPKLFYHSYDLDLNPNLKYQDGKVCLSLLKKWNPKKSTVLEVLVSIQRFILNTKQAESLRYSKHAFTLNCEAMIRNLEFPPRHFEDFVAGHYRNSAHSILLNYRNQTDESEYMTQLFIKLLKIFEVNGTYCKHHLGHIGVQQKEPQEQRGENNGIAVKVFNKFKTLVGLE